MRFIQKLRAASFTTSNFKDQIRNIYIETAKEMAAMQDLYDTQTQHAILKDKQAQWGAKIDSILQTLNAPE